MTRYFFLIVLLLSLTNCSRGWFWEESRYHERVMVQFPTEELSHIVWEISTEFKYGRRIILEESYFAQGPEHSTLRLEFISQDLLEVWQARQLLVDLTEGLLNWINHDPIAHKMSPYPFTADHLEIYIRFEAFHGVYVDPNYVGWMVLEDGISYFYAFSLSDNDKDFWNKRIEPYSKSRSFVMHERQAEAHHRLAFPQRRPSALRELRYEGRRPVPAIH